MAVLDPIKLTITNWPENDHSELMHAVNNPEDINLGKREIPFNGVVYIELMISWRTLQRNIIGCFRK